MCRITNVTSMIAARVLNAQQRAVNQSLERLSTGLRINRASDDPAGLIASEILRGEKASLQAAIANGQRAARVIGTAEGSLNEISSLLTELESLVVSAANEGALGDDEIEAKQLQVDAILSTINRIAGSAAFEGKKLLDGSVDYRLSGVANSALADVNVNFARLFEGQARLVVVEVTASAEAGQVYYANSALAGQNVTIQVTGRSGSEILSFAASTQVSTIADAINQVRELTGVSATHSAGQRLYLSSTEFGTEAFVSVRTISGDFSVSGGTGGVDYGADAAVRINGQAATTRGLTAKLTTESLSMEITLTSDFAQTLGASTFAVTGGGMNFSLSPDVLTGRVGVAIPSLAIGSLGDIASGYLSTLGSGQANALDRGHFGAGEQIIQAAIRQVAALRGRLGAFQKFTIESMIRSQQVALENVSAAESAIRDTDFAEETARLARAQILAQSASAVLRIANTMPNIILQLLSAV